MENAVAEAIRRLGGLTEAVRKTGFSQSTLNEWRAIGRIRDVDGLFKIAELTGLSARALAGRATTPEGEPSQAPRRRSKSRDESSRGSLRNEAPPMASSPSLKRAVGQN